MSAAGRLSRIVEVGGVDDDGALLLVEGDFGPDVFSEFECAVDVLDDRDVPQHGTALGREERGSDHRQDGVLRALDERCSAEGASAADAVTNLLAHAHVLLREADV